MDFSQLHLIALERRNVFSRHNIDIQIIEANVANINTKDEHGNTAIFYALIFRDYKFIHALVRYGGASWSNPNEIFQFKKLDKFWRQKMDDWYELHHTEKLRHTNMIQQLAFLRLHPDMSKTNRDDCWFFLISEMEQWDEEQGGRFFIFRYVPGPISQYGFDELDSYIDDLYGAEVMFQVIDDKEFDKEIAEAMKNQMKK